MEQTDRFYDNNTVVLSMGGNLNNKGPGQMEERTSLVDEVAWEPEDQVCSNYSSCKSAKKAARRSQKAAPRNPHDEEWGMWPVQCTGSSKLPRQWRLVRTRMNAN